MKTATSIGVGVAVSVMATACLCCCAEEISHREQGLVGYWRFDEGSGAVVRDASGRGHHAKIVGKVRRVQGRVGGGVYIGGEKGSGVVVPDADDLNPTSAITIEAWVKPDPLKREATFDIVNKGSDRGPGYRLLVSWAALHLRSGRGYGKDYWNVSASFATTPMTWGIWHHVAGTYDGEVYRLYLDGIEVASGGALMRGRDRIPLDGAAHPVTVNRKPLTIGSYSGGYAYVFKGAIDEVKIYRRAKSAHEVFQCAKEF